MSENNSKIPNQTEVRQIMNEAYNVFYKKWINALTTENAGQMMQEVHELNEKYPFDLCRDLVAGLVDSIEQEYRRRELSERGNARVNR